MSRRSHGDQEVKNSMNKSDFEPMTNFEVSGAENTENTRASLLRLRELVSARDFNGAAEVARVNLSNEKIANFFSTLGRHLSCKGVPDYQTLVKEAVNDSALAEAYRMACVDDALKRSLPVHALDLVLPLPTVKDQSSYGERLLLNTIKDLLLFTSKQGIQPVPLDRIEEALLALVKSLADDPTKLELRAGLVELLQPSVAGTVGLALIVKAVFRFSTQPITLRKSPAVGKENMEWLLKHKPFIKNAFDWMKSQQPLELGKFIIPRELLTEPADKIISGVANYLALAPLVDRGDEDALMQFLTLGCSVVPHSSDPDYDLRLIRILANRFATSSLMQSSRDIAEHALLIGAGSPQRRRLAWFAMADTYARGGDQIESLVALACTLKADDSADEEEVYQEITCLARILRDCGLHDDAHKAIGTARKLLERMGLSTSHAHQLDTLELQIRMMTLSSADLNKTALGQIVMDVVKNGKDVLLQGGMTAPTAVMLGQLLLTAKQNKVAIPDNAEQILADLQRHAHGSITDLSATISTEKPTPSQLLKIVQRVSGTRYSADVGFDLRNVAIIARRAITNDELLKDTEATSFVLDLLADRGVALPNWYEVAVPASPPDSISETANIARIISKTGLNVVQAGFDDAGSLVRLNTVDGNVDTPVRENEKIITKKRLMDWTSKYPYAYGINEADKNLFYTTTENLRISHLPAGPILLVADAHFQSFPPNLLFVDDEFAGRTRPMAAAPSLAWLGEARKQGLIGDGRLCVWISTATGDDSQTLLMIAKRLEPTFIQFGFSIDNGPTLPALFAGATLAIVTAHGGLNAEGNYFQVVSDEGVLRVTAADLANALRNIGVVILFVCSGGRTDKHPAANTTLGLAKQILDRGCSAVVASPWPLDSRVPSHWLPAFLEHWMKGAKLIEANFEANKVVDKAFAQDPARGLAMTVYGNPELAMSPISI